MDGKVAEVAGKHPVAANTHNLARHPPPTVDEKEALRDYLTASPQGASCSRSACHPATPCLMPGDRLPDSTSPERTATLSHPQPQLGLQSTQLLGIKGTLCGPRKSVCGLSQSQVQGCRRWMDGDRRRREKSRRSDQEAHTAGRSPSPAVGRAVSFDKALGSTPSSVVSGL